MNELEGYGHKATSEGTQFGRGRASVYYHKVEDRYKVVLDDQVYGPFTKTQLSLIVHVITDVLEMK